MSLQEVIYEIVKKILNKHSKEAIKSYLDGLTDTSNNNNLSKDTKLALIKESKTLLRRLSSSKNLNEEFSEFKNFDQIIKLSSNQEHLDLLDSVYFTIEKE